MDISVLLCTYNRSKSIKDTLDSLITQEISNNLTYEVLVIDNNSNDNTREVVNSYKQRFNKRIKYIFEQHQGKTYALNTGIKQASGSILSFTDDDVIPNKNWLHQIANNFEDLNTDCVFGKILPIWEDKNIPKWLLQNKVLLTYLAILDYGNKKMTINSRKYLLFGANVSVRKSICEKEFHFNTNLTWSEDVDFFYWLLRNNKKIVYDPEVSVWHKIDKNRLRKSYFRKWSYTTSQNDPLFFKCKRNILGIPIWIIKDVVLRILKYLFFFLSFNFKKLFLEELGLIADMGRISGYLKYAKPRKIILI